MSEPIARKELELRLKLVADMAGGTRSMREFGDATEKVEKSLSKAQKALGGDGKGAGGGLGFWGEFNKAAGGGPSARGFGGELGATLGGYARALGPIALAMHGIQASKAAAAVMHDERLAPDQSARAMFRGLAPFGESILDYADTVSGRKRAMERVEEQHQLRSAELQGRYGALGIETGLARQLDPVFARQRQLAGASPVLMPDIDRRTAAGERLYQIESRLLPVRQRAAAAERDAAAAAEEQAKSTARLADFSAKAARVEADRARLRKDLEQTDKAAVPAWLRYGTIAAAPLTGLGINAVAGDRGTARQALLDREKELIEERNRLDQMRMDESQHGFGLAQKRAEARARVKGGEADVAQIRADELQERAGRAGSAAQRLILGGPGQARFAMQSLEYARRVGIARATPEVAGAISAYFPEDFDRMAREFSSQSPLYGQFSAASPTGYPAGGQEPLEKQALQKQNEAIRLRFEADKELAAAGALAGQQLGRDIGEVLKGYVQKFKDEVLNELKRSLNRPR